jgi:hypothetical protein
VGVFKSERRFWAEVTDLAPVAERLAEHFRAKGYDVVSHQTTAGAWDIDITRTGVFRTISGMRTALKVRLEPEAGSVLARAGIGILGQQALPTVVSMFVFWPVLVTQIWGTVQASQVDDEALAVVERALGTLAEQAPAARAGFCGRCGAPHDGTGRFCAHCGAPLG